MVSVCVAQTFSYETFVGERGGYNRWAGGQVGTGKVNGTKDVSPPTWSTLIFPRLPQNLGFVGFMLISPQLSHFGGAVQSLWCSISPSLLQMKRGKRKSDSPAPEDLKGL